MVGPPASRTSGAAVSPKCSTPSVTPLASTVVMRPAPTPWRRRACGAEEPLDASSTSRTVALPPKTVQTPVAHRWLRHGGSSAAAPPRAPPRCRHTDVRRFLQAGSAHRYTSGLELTGYGPNLPSGDRLRDGHAAGHAPRPTTDPDDGFGFSVRPAQQRPGRACRQSRRRTRSRRSRSPPVAAGFPRLPLPGGWPVSRWRAVRPGRCRARS
jgi:hypothetical protein